MKDDKRSLFEHYPELVGKLPHVILGSFPTQVQELEGLDSFGRANRVYIKRDDLSGRLYGGNKIRKLEFVLADALDKNATEVITYGCDGSNHCLATGIYAKHLGLKSISILRAQPVAAYVRKNLLKNLYEGIELHHYETKEAMAAGAKEQRDRYLVLTGKTPYDIPLGGSSPLGNVGFVNAAYELKDQIDRGELPEPDYLYLATGTLGTAAGLIVGLKALGAKTKVVPVRVNDEARVNKEAMREQLHDVYNLVKRAAPSFPDIYFDERDLQFNHDFFGEEYARFTKEGLAAVQLMDQNYGIQLEGTYTGKAFAGLLADLEHRHENKTILFWNTLNSVDFSKDIETLNYHDLPEEFHYYFEEKTQPYDYPPVE